jgi:CBS-domain-containing membrane protein
VNPETAVLLADDTLETAYRLFNLRDLKMIPIVVAGDKKKVIGVLRREEMISYYNKQLIETLRR